MNVGSGHCTAHMYKYIYQREGDRERERAVPISTVGLELSQTQYSLSVELISHVEPTTREREGGRETAGQDKTTVAERGKRQHYPQTQGYSLVFEETICVLMSKLLFLR